MSSLSQSVSPRHTLRKGRVPYSWTRRVPALSTQEAAAVVLGIIEGRLEEGWTLDQIDWPKYCRDSAVIQVVSQHLAHSAHTTQEISP